MKLWLVVYVGQSIFQVFGPLPMTVEKCNQRALSYESMIKNYDSDPHTAQLSLKCEYHVERPTANLAL